LIATSPQVWDIITVPFPYANRPVLQRRPTLVIARPRGEGTPDLLWVLMITSAGHRHWNGDIPISDLSAAGLSAPSIVRCAKIATLEAPKNQPIGYLNMPDRVAVRRVLGSLLASILGQAFRRTPEKPEM
jgi:mRNA interferase MazF